MESKRCEWCGSDPLYVAYHDEEWGVPLHDENRQFEMLTLEGAQAGLSWLTILRKRENYRKAFAGFDVERVARFSAKDEARLLADPGIVRNRLKVASTISNAQAVLALREKGQTLSGLLWSLIDGKPIQNHRRSIKEVPPKTPESDRMSKELAKRGFRFVGSTICYAHMQATGMVNDHVVTCPRWRALGGGGRLDPQARRR